MLNAMSRRRRVVLALPVILALILATPGMATGEPVRAVVELYTSQGCSSCPPADALLGELAGRPGILALSEHVDYWDYLGWKDPLASAETTDRQRAYAHTFALKYVYTPQVVINGVRQMPGTDRREILAALTQMGAPLALPVTIDGPPGTSTVSIGRPPAPMPQADANVWLFVIEDRVRTAVARGENGGRTLENVNVVREVRHLGRWRGMAASYAFTPPARSGLACAAIVQAADGGRILGAAYRKRCIG